MLERAMMKRMVAPGPAPARALRAAPGTLILKNPFAVRSAR